MPSGPWPVALVTGASSGIGERFAHALAERGCDLVLVARRQERLEEIAQELHGAHGSDVEVLAVDLTDRTQLTQVEERLSEAQPAVDLLINNAGSGTYDPFHELDADLETSQLDLNVTALTRLCHAAAPRMVGWGSGAIMNVSSVAGFQPIPFNATYAASKSYVLLLSEALHEELGRHGVTVTALCPGFVRTGFQDRADVDDDRIPDIAWLDLDTVVETALADLEKGEVVSIPGLGYRALTSLSRLSSRWLTRKVAGTVTRRL